MHLSITKKQMLKKLDFLLKIYFPEDDTKYLTKKLFLKVFNIAYDRIDFCFSRINMKYYNFSKNFAFNHLNTDHMCAFFYFLYSSGYREKLNDRILNKLFYLNKILHSIDIYYEVELPDIVLFVHPLGTVIGKAKFENYLVIYQNVTIGAAGGSKKKLLYPKFGKGVILYSNTSVIGDCSIGNNVIFGANTNIVNKNIKDNKVVLNNFPKNKIMNNNANNIKSYFS